MAERRTRVLRTLTVIGSNAAAQAQGRASIVLETAEEGAIAFEVNQRGIDALRRDLALAEQILRQPKTRN